MTEAPLREGAIRERLGCDGTLLNRLLRAMLADQQLIRTGRGRRNDPYRYALPPA